MKIFYQRKIGAFVIISLLFPFAACNSSKFIFNNTTSQEVQLCPQQTESWCWAASGEMCMKFLGYNNIDQCTEANKKFGRSDCCNNPIPLDCINGNFPEFEKYNFTYSRTSNTALSWMEIKNQLYNLKKPIAFSWRYNGSGGHMMVITGYSTIDGVNWLYINDPLEVKIGSQYSITYTEYVSGPDHTHWDDFYNITKN